MKKMKKITKILTPIVGGLVAIGSIYIFSDTITPCEIELHDVNNQNLVSKMIEKIEEIEVKDKEYKYGCDFEEIEVTNIFMKKNKGIKLSEDNCKTKTKDEWKNFRDDTFDDISHIEDFELEEVKEINKNLIDIWNYHLFEKCGLN